MTGFNFNIPAGVTIKKISVFVEGKSTSPENEITCVLLKNGSAAGFGLVTSMSTTEMDHEVTNGGMWGTTFTPANINAANFGVRFYANVVDFMTPTQTVSFDCVKIAVSYLSPGQLILKVLTVTAETTVSTTLRVSRALSVAVSSAASVTKSMDRVFSTTVNSSTAILKQLNLIMSLAADTLVQASVVKSINRTMSVSVFGIASLLRAGFTLIVKSPTRAVLTSSIVRVVLGDSLTDTVLNSSLVRSVLNSSETDVLLNSSRTNVDNGDT